MKKLMVFCTGISGSGKSTFIDNYLSGDNFYNLKSATTRPMRDDGTDCNKYYFRDEGFFETEKFATKLFVNEAVWVPGKPKWLYGVPETEIFQNINKNFTYDVIEPKYSRQMIDWFYKKRLNVSYQFVILWFLPNGLDKNIVKSRGNMPDDTLVRTQNTCTSQDFKNANLWPDFCIKRILPEGYEIYRPENPDKKFTLVKMLKTIGLQKVN